MSNTATKNQATSKDVKEMAEKLMKANGQTTTKEVKEALRKNGFWAVQTEVSSMMLDLSDSEDWNSATDSSNTYRVYKQDDGTDSSANIFLVSDDDDEDDATTPTDATTTRVVSIMADKLGFDVSEIKTTSDMMDDLGADSLDCVELIMETEKEFNIAIPDDEAEKMRTVGDVIEFVKKATGTTSAPTPGVKRNTPSSGGAAYSRRDGNQIFSTSSPSAGDWSVTSSGSSTMYFDGAYTRDEVRQAYAKMNKIHFHKTRSSRNK